MSKIEAELVEVTALKVKRKEERQDYLVRLMKAVSKLPDPEWEGLTKPAQDWNNGAAEAFKAGDALEDFPDLDEVDEPIDEEVDEEAMASIVEKKKPEKVEKKTQPVVNANPAKKVSACHAIKRIVVKNPKISVAELTEKLKEDGLKVSDVTVATLRSDLRDTLRVLNELNMGEFVL